MYRSRKYNLDENYFKIINTQDKAYLLGLLLSDGYLGKKDYKVGFATIDKELIIFLKECLNAENPIVERIYKLDKKGFEISLNSKILFYDVLKHRQNNLKKDISSIPKEIPDEFIRDFIRGYFDGDGCIRLKNNKSQLNFDISSYEDILKEISFHIDTNINKTRRTTISKHGNIFRIVYAGNKQCKKIYNYLYKDAHLFLKRKREIFEAI